MPRGGAIIYGLFATVWSVMQFVFSPVLGSLSDRFGRRKVILLSNVGLGLDYVLMAMAPSLAWLFLGRVVSGIIEHLASHVAHRQRAIILGRHQLIDVLMLLVDGTPDMPLNPG